MIFNSPQLFDLLLCCITIDNTSHGGAVLLRNSYAELTLNDEDAP